LFDSLTVSEWLRVMMGGVRFDLSAIQYLNIFFILGMILPFASNRRVIGVLDGLFVITNSIGLLLNCIDIVYYPFNLKRMSWSTFSELGTLNNANELLSSFVLRYYGIVLVWVLLVISLLWIVKYFKSDLRRYSWHSYVDGSIITILVVLVIFRGNFRYSSMPLGMRDAGKYVSSPQSVALVFNTPFTVLRTMSEKPLGRYSYFESEKELEEIFNPVQKNEPIKPFDRMNVVILVLESFSEEASGIGNTTGRTFMPFTDSLRRKSLYSEYSVANGKKSIEALPALWSSIPSFEQPYVSSKYNSNRLYGLPKILKDAGYHTSFFHGAPNGSMGFESFSHLMGIDHYFGKNEYNNNSDYDGIWGIWDEPFLNYYSKKLKEFPQPFFSTVFTLSSHDPFKVPEKYQNALPGGEHPIYKTFAYTDQSLRKFFENIKNEPWFNNTVFVISADHTSPQNSGAEFFNSLGVFRIPLFFYVPGRDISGKSDKVFQQIDVMPTVLGILNYPQPFVSFGKNVLNSSSPDFAVDRYGNYQYLYGDFLLKLDAENKGVQLYEFKKDKILQNNLIDSKPEVAASLERKFKGFIQQFQNRMIEDRFTVK
jgi:phosphoglycerol transferase MdoB-like AlkP superfamily enzyme